MIEELAADAIFFGSYGDDGLVVPVTVRLGTASVALDAVLCTTSPVSRIDDQIAARLRGPTESREGCVDVAELALGRLMLRDLVVPLAPMPHHRIKMVLGRDFLAGVLLTLHGPQRMFGLYERTGSIEPLLTTQALRIAKALQSLSLPAALLGLPIYLRHDGLRVAFVVEGDRTALPAMPPATLETMCAAVDVAFALRRLFPGLDIVGGIDRCTPDGGYAQVGLPPGADDRPGQPPLIIRASSTPFMNAADGRR